MLVSNNVVHTPFNLNEKLSIHSPFFIDPQIGSWLSNLVINDGFDSVILLRKSLYIFNCC